MGYYIYTITNKINGKRYIGCTKNIKNRFKNHRSLLKHEKHKNSYLQNAYNKYGLENFSFDILFEYKTSEEMYLNEIKIINESDNLYNLAKGGLGGDTFTDRDVESQNITRKRLSKVSKINNKKNKKLHSKNTTELWKDENYRSKILLKVRENSKDIDYRKKLSKGVKKALEDPEKLKLWSECKKGKANGRWKGYIQIIKDGEVIETYQSRVEAGKKTGISRDTISKKIKDGSKYKRKTSKYNNCEFKEIKI